jgi:hypothetical protein
LGYHGSVRAGVVALGLAACGRIGFDVGGTDAHGDASLGDAPLDAPPPSLCATAGFVMCDGFETGMVADPPWSSNFSVTVDTEHVYRGMFAAHAETPAVTTEGLVSYLIDNTNRATFEGSTAYLRAFLYLTSASASSFSLVAVDPLSNAADQAALVDVNDGELGVLVDSTTMTNTSVAMPTDRWTCLELSARASTTTSSGDAELVVWLDGAQIADVTSFDLSPSQQFVLGLSLYDVGAQPASDLWMDEVALDVARIGCER